MKHLPWWSIALLSICVLPTKAEAFCGFYVAKADTKLYNKASQVVLVRNEDKTVLTMVNDYKGEMKEFAVVIPVPTMITREQIHVADKAIIDHLDAYSAPRLVEYFDEDPCAPRIMMDRAGSMPMAAKANGGDRDARARSLGVKIEAQYTVGEYDILILSAKQSDGLETWLAESGYRIPAGASAVLGSYIKQNMKFFVAKVNLSEQNKLGFSFLRPLQVAYETPKYMLPIRLGTVNADGPQELFIYTLTRKGRVETTNYRNVKLPTGMDIPLFVKNEFADFYKAMFDEQVRKENMTTIFTEYAWDMNWCDPCAADPLSAKELKELGVFWLNQGPVQPSGMVMPPRPMPPSPSGAQEVFLTRLHVRYDGAHFPEDLVFQETADRQNFQGRYVLRHPWRGRNYCPAMNEYQQQVQRRQEQEAQNLASLTGWTIGQIRSRMGKEGPPPSGPGPGKKWYEEIWN